MEEMVFMGLQPVSREQAEKIQAALKKTGVKMTVYTNKPQRTKGYTMTHLLALQVLRGVWGNGHERRVNLERFGYDYDKIQEYLNDHLDELKGEM